MVMDDAARLGRDAALWANEKRAAGGGWSSMLRRAAAAAVPTFAAGARRAGGFVARHPYATAATAPIAAGHAYNAGQGAINRIAGGDPETAYSQAQSGYKDLLSQQQSRIGEIGDAGAGGPRLGGLNPFHQPAADRMATARRDLVANNLGHTGVGPRLGGLNPFYGDDAQSYLGRAQAATGRMQQQYTDAASPEDRSALSGRLEGLQSQLGQAVFPEQRQVLEQEMHRLRGQLEAPSGQESPYARQVRFRMTALGMPDPAQHMPEPAGGGGYGGGSGLGGYYPPGGGPAPDATGYRPSPWELNDRRYAHPDDFRARPGIGYT